ncbi:MAG: hypothetical protein ACRD3O_06925 [Terriglobia bacterium]
MTTQPGVAVLPRLCRARVYDLPFFRSQKGFRGEALGGWELSGITTYESGTPVTVGLTGPNHGLAGRPNVNGPIADPGTIPEYSNSGPATAATEG